MSPDGFAPCRVFELGASRGLASAVVTVYAAAALAVLCAQLPWPLRIGAAIALAFAGRRALRRHAMRTAPDAVVRLVRRADGGWAALRNDGAAVVGALADDSYVNPWLVVVGIKDGWRTLYTPIPADALPPDDHRRLRVWVKWQPPPPRRTGFPGTP